MILELQKQEQTPDVQAQIKELSAEVKKRKKAAEAMQAGKQKNVTGGNVEEIRASQLITFEKWSLELNKKTGELVRNKMIREVRIPQEHADERNTQKMNALIEFVKKS